MTKKLISVWLFFILSYFNDWIIRHCYRDMGKDIMIVRVNMWRVMWGVHEALEKVWIKWLEKVWIQKQCIGPQNGEEC